MSIRCPHCREYDVSPKRSGVEEHCPCQKNRTYAAVLLPPYFETKQAVTAERIVDETEASCFNHPNRRASSACESCGVFVCSMCETSHDGKTICLSCMVNGVQSHEGTKQNLARSVIAYDKIALSVSLIPLLIWFITCITAPIALFIVIKHWNDHVTVIPRSRWRFVVAGLVALVQVIGWLVLIAALIWDFE